MRESKGKSKPVYWDDVIQDMQDKRRGVKLHSSIADYLYEIGSGQTKGNVPALIHLSQNAIRKNEDRPISDYIKIKKEDLESIEAIDKLASRILFLTIDGSIPVVVAERIMALMERKVAFIETANVLSDLDRLQKAVEGQGVSFSPPTSDQPPETEMPLDEEAFSALDRCPTFRNV